MSTNKIAGLLGTVLLVAVAACGGKEKEFSASPPMSAPNQPVNPPSPAAKPSHPRATRSIPKPCAAAKESKRELEELRGRYSDDHPDVVRLRKFAEAAQAQCSAAPSNKSPSGEWQVQDGVRVCDGYILRYADQDYCSAEVPEDWVPFSFDGQEYYLQPLKDPDHDQAIPNWR